MADAAKKKCVLGCGEDRQDFPAIDHDWFKKHDFPKDGLLCYDCNCAIGAIVLNEAVKYG